MNISFAKYQGAGNDFIMIDGRNNYQLSEEQIWKLCNRHFGIGSDGLIILMPANDADYEMLYYNSDGRIGSMCGNGSRCAFEFANEIGLINKPKIFFKAFDGIHTAEKVSDSTFRISMNDVQEIKLLAENIFETNTGSPHYIKFISEVNDFDIEKFGYDIRNSEVYKANGINVNVAEVISENELSMRTYERGVEAETLACGTGTVAVALCYHCFINSLSTENEISIHARGGDLKVFFRKNPGSNSYSDIFLQGEARKVFEGKYLV